MARKFYVVDVAVDKENPDDGYDIVESVQFSSYREAKDAFDNARPRENEHVFLGKVYNINDDPNNCTTLICK